MIRHIFALCRATRPIAGSDLPGIRQRIRVLEQVAAAAR